MRIVHVDSAGAPRRPHAGGTADDPARAVAFYREAFGWTADFTDPEGNAFGIMQFDPSAA